MDVLPSITIRLLAHFAEISAEMMISLSTVKSHLASVQRKISARNRTEIAWESGLMQ